MVQYTAPGNPMSPVSPVSEMTREANLDRDSETLRQCAQVPASVDDGSFGNIPDGLAFTAGERVTGAELKLDARFRAAEGRE